MVLVEVVGLLTPGQYGSQKPKLTNLQCPNKRLLYDIVLFQHQLAALGSNDAICYNHIVFSCSNINWLPSVQMMQYATIGGGTVSMPGGNINSQHCCMHSSNPLWHAALHQTTFGGLTQSQVATNGVVQ